MRWATPPPENIDSDILATPIEDLCLPPRVVWLLKRHRDHAGREFVTVRDLLSWRRQYYRIYVYQINDYTLDLIDEALAVVHPDLAIPD